MVNNTVVIPIAVLSAVVVIGFICMLFWFPRMWNKGNKDERQTVDGLTEEQKACRAERVAWAQQILSDAGYRGDRETRSGRPEVVAPPPPYPGHENV